MNIGLPESDPIVKYVRRRWVSDKDLVLPSLLTSAWERLGAYIFPANLFFICYRIRSKKRKNSFLFHGFLNQKMSLIF